MKILHVIESMGSGGAERNLANLFEPLTELGIENFLLTLRPGCSYPDRVSRHVAKAEFNVLTSAGSRAPERFFRLAREADIVHTHLVWSDIAGRMAGMVAGTPVITTLHSTWYDPRNVARLPARVRAQVRVVGMLDRATGKTVRRFFAVSEAVKDSYVRGLRIAPDRIEVMPNAVDLSEFDPLRFGDREEVRARLHVRPHEFAVVTVARLAEQKDHATAIRAVAALTSQEKVHLYVVGTGPLESELRALAGELQAPVTFLGTRGDVPQILYAADMFLLPTYFEGMSVALMEAMAMALPCLCSDIAENRQVAGDAALYVPPGSSQELAAELQRLIHDPKLGRRLGERAHARAQSFDSHRVAARLLQSIEAVL